MIEFLGMIHSSGPEWIDSVINKSSITITKSIFPSKKELWSPSNELAVEVMGGISHSLGIEPGKLNRVEIEGEDSLLLLKTNNGYEWSFSIRNSGTEPKTRVTIRTNDAHSNVPSYIMSQIITLLEPELKVGVRSS
jgi:phosphomannomutase